MLAKATKNKVYGLTPSNNIERFFDDVLSQSFDLWDWVAPYTKQSMMLGNERKFINIAPEPVRKKEYEDGKVRIEFDVPGFDKENLELSYEEGVLNLVSTTKAKDDNAYFSKSINYKLYVPDLDVSTMQARYEKGMLVIDASTIKESTNKRLIEIK